MKFFVLMFLVFPVYAEGASGDPSPGFLDDPNWSESFMNRVISEDEDDKIFFDECMAPLPAHQAPQIKRILRFPPSLRPLIIRENQRRFWLRFKAERNICPG